MRIPRATYRIQFSPDFGFEAAADIVEYLRTLGISDLYASPIFKARPGSPHGYDVVDPTKLNPELGSQESFDALIRQLQRLDMGWLQDIVPNHMAYDSNNEWLMDVLENGPASDYVSYFDLAWNSPFEANTEPILVPLLGSFYGEALENGEIQLKYDANGFYAQYWELRVPLRLDSYNRILTHNSDRLRSMLDRNDPIYARILGSLYLLRSVPEDLVGEERREYNRFVKGLLWDLYTDSPAMRAYIDDTLRIFNGEPGNPESYNLLDSLLTSQYFRLAYWKVGAEEMNYRRFFTVNELLGVRVEDEAVFEHTHQLIQRMVTEQRFTGLRVDHIDGLFDPTKYLTWLRERMGDIYLVVEKILQPGERLPPMWDIQGTSGYDYLNMLNGIFCRSENEDAFNTLYYTLAARDQPFDEIAAEKKLLIIETNLAGDIDNLAVWLKRLSGVYRYGNDFTVNSLRRALIAVLARFPIYRTYTNRDGVLEQDQRYIEAVIAEAKEHTELMHNELNYIEKLMLLNYDANISDEEKEPWLYWVMRVQQYTGPLMAKGVEDTALYVYNRLLSLNEVGGEPSRFGVSLEEFHTANQVRQERWPAAMSATATHDTKRGEDVRARINVLSELPAEWLEQNRKWAELNRPHKTRVRNVYYPGRNDEYALYQTLIGTFPPDGKVTDEYVQRVRDYMLKAVREAKVYTAWLRTNEVYEDALLKFVDAILANPTKNKFLQEFRPFQQRIAFYGMLNSLSQTLIKITSPGVPDLYQGAELWDLSMVDPDNRRPVDFDLRRAYLEEINARVGENTLALVQELRKHKEDGRIKLFLIAQALKARQEHLPIFRYGAYVPLAARGSKADHVVAYARQDRITKLVVIAPRFYTGLVDAGVDPIGKKVWGNTAVRFEEEAPRQWKNLLTGESFETGETLPLASALAEFPVALLVGHLPAEQPPSR